MLPFDTFFVPNSQILYRFTAIVHLTTWLRVFTLQSHRPFGALAFLLLAVGLYTPLFADTNPTVGQTQSSLAQEVGAAVLAPVADLENVIQAVDGEQFNAQPIPAITLAISFLPLNASTSRLTNGAFSSLSRAVRPAVAALRSVPVQPLASCLVCPPPAG